MMCELLVGIGFCCMFVVLGLLFRSGRGAWLIAGYNTLPPKKRERYDRQALCRFMARLMFFCAACTTLLVADTLQPGRGLGIAGRLWMTIGIIGAVIYANTGGRFLKR